MKIRRWRWSLVPGACLACVLLPACSATEAKAKPQAESPAAPPRPSDAAGKARAPATPKTAATGAARRHPFAPALDEEARRAQLVTKTGSLVLQGILEGDIRAAIIQEGQKVRFVREGEQVGGLVLLSIGKGEVVLGAGPRKRILTLYEP